MKPFTRRIILSALLSLAAAGASAQSPAVPSRGELLYTTHCVSCHTAQMHWRDKLQAYDWSSLNFQVRRWQGNVGLGWSDDDITEVARYLNDGFYGYPSATAGLARPQHGSVCASTLASACTQSRAQP